MAKYMDTEEYDIRLGEKLREAFLANVDVDAINDISRAYRRLEDQKEQLEKLVDEMEMLMTKRICRVCVTDELCEECPVGECLSKVRREDD